MPFLDQLHPLLGYAFAQVQHNVSSPALGLLFISLLGKPNLNPLSLLNLEILEAYSTP